MNRYNSKNQLLHKKGRTVRVYTVLPVLNIRIGNAVSHCLAEDEGRESMAVKALGFDVRE